MIQIKKTILTLALLLTAVTGAWADQLASSYSSNATLNAVTVSASMEVTIATGVTVTINNGLNITSGTLTVKGPGTLVVNGKAGSNGGTNGLKGSTGGNGGVAISGNIIVQGGATVTATGGNGGKGGNGDMDGGNGGNGGVAIAGTLTYKSGTVTANGGSAGSGGWGEDMERYASSGSAGKAFANDVDFTQTTGYSVTNGTSTIGSVLNQRKVVISGGSEPAIPSGPEVAWDEAEKTGTFKMPGGNVTLEPEYYPQATLAFQGLTAAEDAAAKTEAPLAVVADGAVTGGTLMYYVATDKNFSQADAIALAETQWSADIPTAETIDAAGTYIMWYYIKGDAEHSDTDPIPLVVTLLPEPTYAVTFAEGTDPNEWTADPATGVKKGTPVTVTYTGTRKVIGVKAEKKAAAPASNPLDNTTTAWSAGTFAVPAGGLTYSDAITVSGDVTLVLTDGTTLTLNKGISLASGATLTIQGNGTMVVNGTNESTASTVAGTGTLVLTSGTLTARGGNGGSVGVFNYHSHGGNGGNAINGSVIVSGGTLTARGGNGGSVGEASDDCSGGNGGDAISGTLTINGGSTSVNNGSNGSIGEDCEDCTAGTGGKAVAGTVTDNR